MLGFQLFLFEKESIEIVDSEGVLGVVIDIGKYINRAESNTS